MAHTVQSGIGVEPARMTAQWCYKKDSGCTHFCADVPNPDYRYECFRLCDKYLDNCLSKGVWTDKAARF